MLQPAWMHLTACSCLLQPSAWLLVGHPSWPCWPTPAAAQHLQSVLVVQGHGQLLAATQHAAWGAAAATQQQHIGQIKSKGTTATTAG